MDSFLCTHFTPFPLLSNMSNIPSDHSIAGTLTKRAMEKSISEGRGGLGAIYVWAGGNGKERGDNANYDGYANSPYTISVSAHTSGETKAKYSEEGSCILISAPSSGDRSDPKIVTSTLVSQGACTNRYVDRWL